MAGLEKRRRRYRQRQRYEVSTEITEKNEEEEMQQEREIVDGNGDEESEEDETEGEINVRLRYITALKIYKLSPRCSQKSKTMRERVREQQKEVDSVYKVEDRMRKRKYDRDS